MTPRYLFIAALALVIQGNEAPFVKIQSTKAGIPLPAASPIRYEITVTDKEDGDSRYDEINPKEVVLMIRAAGSSPSATHGLRSGPQNAASLADPLKDPGLALMARSNCFNCHRFNGKLIGPSLADIARHYQNTTATTDTISKRIKDGSAGIWGKEKMPSHPEVTMEDIHAMVRWIEKYAAAPGITYQNGITGVLQFPASASAPAPTPGSTPTPGTYTLTAAYTDHGTKDTKTGPWLTGLDQVTFTVK